MLFSVHEHVSPSADVQSDGAACVPGGAESPPSIDICIIDEAIRPESCSGRWRRAAEVTVGCGVALTEQRRWRHAEALCFLFESLSSPVAVLPEIKAIVLKFQQCSVVTCRCLH